MARQRFEDVDQPSSWWENKAQISQITVCAIGFILMLFGLWIGLVVISDTWSLY